MNHIIQQQHFHISLRGTELQGLALQKWLSGYCADWLTPAMEHVLDRCSPADGHVSIEKLEIDLGTISQERLEQDLTGAIVMALEAAIREQVAVGLSDSSSAGNMDVQLKSGSQSNWEAFIYFLENGRLPWSFRLPKGGTLETVLQSQVSRAVEYDSLRIVLSNQNARLRLVNQFSTAFLDRMIASLSEEGKKQFDQLIAKLKGAGNLTINDVAFFEKSLRLVVIEKIAGGGPISEDAMVERWIQVMNEGRGDNISNAGKERSPDMLQKIWPKAFEATEELIRPITAMGDETNSFRSKRDEEVEGIYIDNAGLILVHPFLPRFLEALGIARDDKLIQPSRALVLLHFLATGRESPMEYELTLPKLFCNLPLETPVDTDFQLLEIERAESENLLNAVIRHWGALGNSSSEALREAFLSRPGKLSCQNDDGWLLQVERNSFDILLDRMPWNISMIRLPWMGEMIHVEWN